MCNVCAQADATLEMAERHFSQASLEYVFLLQEVQERKKFEFVETVIIGMTIIIFYCVHISFAHYTHMRVSNRSHRES